MLKVKKLNPNAILPTVAHPGEDLGFDLYALEDTVLPYGVTTAVPTGIAASFVLKPYSSKPVFPSDNMTYWYSGTRLVPNSRKFGLLIKDRSSMATKGIKTSAGVIDAGYTGELKVMMTNGNKDHNCRSEDGWLNRGSYQIKAGDKIAQMIPTEVFTGEGISEVTDLGDSSRGAGGFGSSGA
jgi:dUTP pyrophosphatase